MNTAEFPAVKQAREVVEKQARFYISMMSDENDLRHHTRNSTTRKGYEMNLQNLVDVSLQFNEISGADKETSIQAIEKQMNFVVDEAVELKEAVNNYYLTFTEEGEIVKEALDVLVTVVGLLQKMENRGYDIEAAANEVGLNNLSKYPKTHADATQSLQDLAKQGVDAYVAYNPVYNCYVIRDVETGKVRKPSNYVKINSDNFPKKG